MSSVSNTVETGSFRNTQDTREAALTFVNHDLYHSCAQISPVIAVRSSRCRAVLAFTCRRKRSGQMHMFWVAGNPFQRPYCNARLTGPIGIARKACNANTIYGIRS
jgi:hypothetical protein